MNISYFQNNNSFDCRGRKVLECLSSMPVWKMNILAINLYFSVLHRSCIAKQMVCAQYNILLQQIAIRAIIKGQLNFGVFTFVEKVVLSQEQQGFPVTVIYISPCFGYMASQYRDWVHLASAVLSFFSFSEKGNNICVF